VVGLVFLDTPPVHRVADAEPFGIGAAPTHSNTTEQQVNEASHAPEPVVGVPAGSASDTADWSKRLRRGHVQLALPRVSEAAPLAYSAVAAEQARIEESAAMGEVRLALRPYGRVFKLGFRHVR
jgi:hypothetical protein